MKVGIPTYYAGTMFRSRVEARWAAFFDLLGWLWTYEPFDGNGYIPDFVLQGDRPLVVEVKSAVTPQEFDEPIDKIIAGLTGVWAHDVLIVGADPLPRLKNNWGLNSEHPPIGLLGEYEGPGSWVPEGNGWCFDAGNWSMCLKCQQPAAFHDFQCYRNRPCGHYSGDAYLGAARPDVIRLLWNEAGNKVQWKAPSA